MTELTDHERALAAFSRSVGAPLEDTLGLSAAAIAQLKAEEAKAAASNTKGTAFIKQDSAPKMPPWRPNIIAAVGQIFTGVTVESAARANSCTVAELNKALQSPEAKLVESTAEWDATDLLSAEFQETPDILTGVVPVGLTLISAAPKVGKSRLLMQLSVAAVRGTPFMGYGITQTKVLTLSLEDGARRYRKALSNLIGTQAPTRGQLTIRTTSARLDEGGLTEIEQHLDKHPDCR
jgi:RecA-family ATPase